MSSGGNESILVSGVVNSVGDTVGADVLVESLSPNAVFFRAELLQLASLLGEDLVLSLIEIVVAVGKDVAFLADDTVFVVITRSYGGTLSVRASSTGSRETRAYAAAGRKTSCASCGTEFAGAAAAARAADAARAAGAARAAAARTRTRRLLGGVESAG